MSEPVAAAVGHAALLSAIVLSGAHVALVSPLSPVRAWRPQTATAELAELNRGGAALLLVLYATAAVGAAAGVAGSELFFEARPGVVVAARTARNVATIW